MINFVRTHYSYESFNKPNELPASDQVAIIDTTLGGIVRFYEAAKKAGVRPIIGYTGKEIYLARNKEEYHNLLKSYGNCEPNVLKIIGLPHSETADLVFTQYYPPVLKDDAYDSVKTHIKSMAGNILIGLSREILPVYKILNDLLKDVAAELGLDTIIVNECYYQTPEAAKDHLIQICYRTKATIKKPPEEEKYKRFFLTDQFVPGPPVEIKYDFEDYEILGPPSIPVFNSDMTPDEKLKDLCRAGWKKKIAHLPDTKPYLDRIKEEFLLWEEHKLSSYFLIMADIVDWIAKQGWLAGSARGSAAGCLTSYLLGISHVDPLKHGLLLERFYNPSRKGELPDIDQDVPKFKRGEIIEYIKNKYGADSVSQIITFATLGGRSALKAVLRFTEKCDFNEMNRISDLFPELAKVEDQMKAAEDSSLIAWSIKTYPERFQQYARIEDNKLIGDYAEEFEQAIRIENTIVDYGQHASGIIIYNGKISDVAPLVLNKQGENLMCGLDLDDAQKVSLVKVDILGLAALDRIMLILDLINGR